MGLKYRKFNVLLFLFCLCVSDSKDSKIPQCGLTDWSYLRPENREQLRKYFILFKSWILDQGISERTRCKMQGNLQCVLGSCEHFFFRIDFGIFNLLMIFMGVLPVCMQCPQKPRAASVFNPSAIPLAL